MVVDHGGENCMYSGISWYTQGQKSVEPFGTIANQRRRQTAAAVAATAAAAAATGTGEGEIGS